MQRDFLIFFASEASELFIVLYLLFTYSINKSKKISILLVSVDFFKIFLKSVKIDVQSVYIILMAIWLFFYFSKNIVYNDMINIW